MSVLDSIRNIINRSIRRRKTGEVDDLDIKEDIKEIKLILAYIAKNIEIETKIRKEIIKILRERLK